jgi:hypothetical protein
MKTKDHVMRDADTHLRTKELIQAIKREVALLQDDVVHGRGSDKIQTLISTGGLGYWSGGVSR